MPFDMPPLDAGYPARGRWLIDHLSADFELTERQAAGIVGNMGFESMGLKVLQEISPVAGRGGFGWEQWTGPRRRAYEAWCAAQALSPSSDEANFGFAEEELRGTYRYVIEALKRTATLEAAVFVFGVDDEAPGGTTPTFLPGDSGRLAYAKLALAGDAPAPAPVDDDEDVIAKLHPAALKLIQQALLDKRIYRGHVDGIYGALTKAAWEAYSASVGA